MKRIRKIIIVEILILIIIIVFISISFILSNDPKTILVKGGEWTSHHIGHDGTHNDTEIYVFFEDGSYEYEETWDKGNSEFTYWRSSGTYYIEDDKLYLTEEISEINIGSGWSNTLVKWDKWEPLEIIDSNTIKIGSYEFSSLLFRDY